MTMAAILNPQLDIAPELLQHPIFCRLENRWSLMSIKHVHLYNSRSMSFVGDGVLQENIIVSAKKNRDIGKVVITSCDDPLDHDITVQEIEVDELVRRRDRSLVIHLARNRNEQLITRLIQGMNCNLQNLNINVSTGRVVDFRARELLRTPYDLGSVHLGYPMLHNGVSWPIKNCKETSATWKIAALMSWWSGRADAARDPALWDTKKFLSHLNYFLATVLDCR